MTDGGKRRGTFGRTYRAAAYFGGSPVVNNPVTVRLGVWECDSEAGRKREAGRGEGWGSDRSTQLATQTGG